MVNARRGRGLITIESPVTVSKADVLDFISLIMIIIIIIIIIIIMMMICR